MTARFDDARLVCLTFPPPALTSILDLVVVLLPSPPAALLARPNGRTACAVLDLRRCDAFAVILLPGAALCFFAGRADKDRDLDVGGWSPICIDDHISVAVARYLTAPTSTQMMPSMNPPQATPNTGGPAQTLSGTGASNGTTLSKDGKDTDATPNGAGMVGDGPEKSNMNAMLESKEKAKAMIAASGLSAESGGSRQPSPKQPAPSLQGGAQSNGEVRARKRSRSGTRIPQSSQSLSSELPRRTKEVAEKVLLEQYVNRDLVHSAAMIVDKFEQNNLIKSKVDEVNMYKKLQGEQVANPGAIFGHGYARYNNGPTNVQTRGPKLVYPSQRARPGGRLTKELHIPKKDLATQSEQLDELAPIRLDIEWDKIRLRDTFTWNIHDRVIPPRLFAEQLVEDFNILPNQRNALVQQVYSSLHEQIQDFHPQVFTDEEPLDPHLPYHAYKNDEMRIAIKLNITIGQHTLMDQFEWEINNPMNSPEEFARQMTRDLSLSGEFATAIAHSIREQSQLFTQSLFVTGHPFDGRPVEDQELKASFLPSPLPSPFRAHQAVKDFMPYLFELNELELEKTELSLSREERRQKRSVNRRGGPALPDLKDRRRTIRTLVLSSVLPGAAETMEESRIYKRSATSSKSRRPGVNQKDGLDDSDDSESEDSSPESPAMPSYLNAGTARTRNMRGAASAAQAAMRANIGRSATPESLSLHHHETRTSGRRVGGREYREESADSSPSSFIVKLKIPREKYRHFLTLLGSRSRGETLQPQSTNHPHHSSQRSQSATPGTTTPAPGSMGPPSTTPRLQQQQLPSQQNGAVHPQQPQGGPVGPQQQPPPAPQLGRVEAKAAPSPNHPIVS